MDYGVKSTQRIFREKVESRGARTIGIEGLESIDVEHTNEAGGCLLGLDGGIDSLHKPFEHSTVQKHCKSISCGTRLETISTQPIKHRLLTLVCTTKLNGSKR